MPPSFSSRLTLPNDPDSLSLARAFVREFAALAELPGGDGEALVEAGVEACANVLDHAFEPGEEATFTLAGELGPMDLVLSVQDQGLPFDPSHAGRPASRARLSHAGGMALIQQAVDRAQWLNHGRAGKELRLIKHRPQRDVTEELPEEQLQALAEDAPLAPEQDYTICLLRREHALGVSRCIYRVYGNTYIHEDCYYPERILRLNDTGELVSIVALDETGDVVGHYALERPGLTPVAERGIAVVSPSHRGRDLMGRMRVLLEEEARRLGLVGVYSVAVAKHVFSQRVNESFGSDVCGLLLGGGPSHQVFKKIAIAGGRPERVSYVLYYTYVRKPERAAVYAPEHHQDVLRQVYSRLEVPVEFRAPAPPAGEGDLAMDYRQTLEVGTIRVLRVGEDTAAEVARARRDLCEQAGAEAVELHLPLAQPGTPELCRAAEEEGFFFAGLGPSFLPDGDALILQYLAVPLDTSLLQLASPLARDLLGYIEQERARVGGAGMA